MSHWSQEEGQSFVLQGLTDQASACLSSLNCHYCPLCSLDSSHTGLFSFSKVPRSFLFTVSCYMLFLLLGVLLLLQRMLTYLSDFISNDTFRDSHTAPPPVLADQVGPTAVFFSSLLFSSKPILHFVYLCEYLIKVCFLVQSEGRVYVYFAYHYIPSTCLIAWYRQGT